MPNIVNGCIGLSGLLAQICLPHTLGVLGALTGCLMAGALLSIPFVLRVYRGGDVKLMMAVGLWLGPSAISWAVFLGVALGGLIAVGMLALQPKVRSLFQNAETPIEDRPKSAHVPMALAFGAATCLSLWVPAPWSP